LVGDPDNNLHRTHLPICHAIHHVSLYQLAGHGVFAPSNGVIARDLVS